MDNHGKELTQIAAVAVASLENERFGQANANALVFTEDGTDLVGMQAYIITDDVIAERLRQEEKFGTDRLHSRIEWGMILAEEIGEWAEEITGEDVAEALGADTLEYSMAVDVLSDLSAAGRRARRWLESHRWESTQQQAVMDAEVREAASSE